MATAMSSSGNVESETQLTVRSIELGDMESIEPDLTNTAHMKFVDGRCACCPYGYHIDLDFLRYLDSLNKSGGAAANLSHLHHIHDNKKKLRKSMEVFLRKQGLQMSSDMSSGLQMSSRQSHDESRQLMSMVEQEDAITSRFLDDIDSSITEQFESATNSLKVEPRYRSQAELTLSQPPNRLLVTDYDSSSSISVSSGPPSPGHHLTTSELLQHQTDASLTQNGMLKTTTVTTSKSASETGAVSYDADDTSLGSHTMTEIITTITNGPPGDMTMISSATLQAIREQMATSLQRMKELEEENKALRVFQVRVSVLKEEKKMLELQLRAKQVSTCTVGVGECTIDEYFGPDTNQSMLDSSRITPDMNRLTRLHNGADFSTDIQIIRKVNLGATSPLADTSRPLPPPIARKPCRGVGVGDGNVFALMVPGDRTKPSKTIGFGDGNVFSNDEFIVPQICRPDLGMNKKPCQSIGVGDGNVFVSETAVAAITGHEPSAHVREREISTERNTELHEKMVKTVFLGGGIHAAEQFVGSTKPKMTRSIGVGSGNVFDLMQPESTSLQVHEKELRTVYMDGGAGLSTPRKSTRNVGILCKPAMREVGVMYYCDDESPMTRSIAVGAGEIGVNELGYFGTEGGGQSDTSVHVTNMALQQLNMAAFQSRHLRFSNDQLREVLDAMLKKNLRSVAVQCRFATVDRGVGGSVNAMDDDRVSVGVSDDTVDVNVVPIRQFRSVAIDNRPSLFHRACGADFVYRIDSATNTYTQGIKVDRSINTDTVVRYPAATNTEPQRGVSVSTETEPILLGTESSDVDDSVVVRKEVETLSQPSTTTGNVSVSVMDTHVVTDTHDQTTSGSHTITHGLATDKGTTSGLLGSDTMGSHTVTHGLATDKGTTSGLLGSHTMGSHTVTHGLATDKGTTSGLLGSNTMGSHTITHGLATDKGSLDMHGVVGSTSCMEYSHSIASDKRPFADGASAVVSSSSDTRVVSGGPSDSELNVGGSRADTQQIVTTYKTIQGSSSVHPATDGCHVVSGSSEIHSIVGGLSDSQRVISGSSDRVGTRDLARQKKRDSMSFGISSEPAVIPTDSSVNTTVELSSSASETALLCSPGSSLDSFHLSSRTMSEPVVPLASASSSETFTTVSDDSSSVPVMDSSDGSVDTLCSVIMRDAPAASSSSVITKTVRTVFKQDGSGGGQLMTGHDNADMMRLRLEQEGLAGAEMFETKPLTGGGRIIITETRVERQPTGIIVGDSASDSSLRSIMKSSSSFEKDQSPVLRRKITFIEDTNRNRESSGTDVDVGTVSESDDSQRSSASFEEGTYDGRHGYVTYTCKEDVTDRGVEMFDQHVHETFEMTHELSAACGTYALWLDDSTQVSAKDLNASMMTIQQEWFTVSSHKLANAAQVAECLKALNSISRSLLEHIVNMADANGNTALHYAVSHGNFEIVSLLLDTGIVNANCANRAGYTAVMLASLADVQTDRQRDIVQRLFQAANVNLRASQAGQTALMLAVSHGKLELVRMLIDAGADVNMQDDDGSTALMCASEHGHVDIVKLLLAQSSCDANIADNDGSTALSIAMEAGHRDIGVMLYAHVNFRSGSPLKKKTVTVTQRTFSTTKKL